MNGTLIDIIRTYDGKFRVTFEVDSDNELNGINGLLDITVKKITRHRSLNANKYFHVLVGKIAEAMIISKARAKNILLAKYGQREMTDSGQLIISVRSDVDLMEHEIIHAAPIGTGYVNGVEFTHWAIIRGSHTYDNLEMRTLIDGTVSDALEQKIQVLSPDEIERMKAAWKSNQS